MPWRKQCAFSAARGGPAGGSRAGGKPASGVYAAALKLQMALAMFASFRRLPSDDAAGYARLSFSDLESLCDISRRYLALGLAALEHHGLITTHAIGNANRYLLSQFELAGWAKLPRAHLLEEHRFRGLGLRGAASLTALKLYLALVTFRPNQARHVLLSYDKIEHYTGIPRPRIRHAIDVLINHDWISIATHAVDPIAGDITDHRKPTNVYILRGDFWGRPPTDLCPRVRVHRAALLGPLGADHRRVLAAGPRAFARPPPRAAPAAGHAGPAQQFLRGERGHRPVPRCRSAPGYPLR